MSDWKKILGILGLLVVVCVLTTVFSEHFLTSYNIENVLRRSALFAIISIGAAFVIMTGGIDLSIGSVICLVGCLTPWLLVHHGWSPWAAVPLMLVLSVALGAAHGLIVTKLRIWPFLVTLCALFFYRGIARAITEDQTQGFRGEFEALRALGNGRVPLPFIHVLREPQRIFGLWTYPGDFALPAPVLILIVVAVAAGVFLKLTVYGRYLLALGRNEVAARYSGIGTHRMIILAYVICGLLSGLGGMLFVLDVGSAQPVDFGNFYELYAIAAAVLGGCSLRGGEGTILGVIIGAAVVQVLRNSITLIDWIPDNVEYAVIGAVILVGVIADEQIRGVLGRRRG